ncbi:hypothetical protein EVAR_87056_1 [Eumeta japonica]|uniref:Uncharacterized protein n=1 Tax=Eumeta variegata TaxID=151549 RepID=A0A4C1VSL6_EUMVA|nr:hypothetical protein EVAR_87056_1 [Eumeta japonica]
MLFGFGLAILFFGVVLRTRASRRHGDATPSERSYADRADRPANATAGETRRKEYLYRLLTNTTRSLIQMEIKARRLEENMRRIEEKTADLLWKNKDKALWRILFKNISRRNAIRHEFHQHASLKRIMQDSAKHVHRRRRRRSLQ